MYVPKQTITELYLQLDSLGFTATDLLAVNKAYILAIHLFNGAYRGNGKPFLCHLVGTASITAHLGLGINPTIAALLHSVFTHGVFSDGSVGPTTKNINTILHDTNNEVIDLIAEYSNCKFKDSDIDDIISRCKAGNNGQRTIYLMRLANEFDEFYDLSIFATGKRGTSCIQRLQKCSELAECLDSKELAVDFLSCVGKYHPKMPLPAYSPSSKSYRLIPKLLAWWRIRHIKNIYFS